MAPQVQVTKEKKKINWISSKLKTLCVKGHYQESKKIIHRTRKPRTEKGLKYRIYKEHSQLTNKRQITIFLNKQKI